MNAVAAIISAGSQNLPFGLNGAAAAMILLAGLLVYKLKNGGRGGAEV